MSDVIEEYVRKVDITGTIKALDMALVPEDKAKEIIMKQYGLTEDQAEHYMADVDFEEERRNVEKFMAKLDKEENGKE